MARKVVMRKVVNSTLHDIYPKSMASIVYMDDGTTVQSVLTSLLSTVQNLVDAHTTSSDSVYMLDSNEQIETDSDGTGLVNIF